MKLWNDYYLRQATQILSRHRTLADAVAVMNIEFPFQVTKDSLGRAFSRHVGHTPGAYLATGLNNPMPPAAPPMDREPSTERRPWSRGPAPPPEPRPSVSVVGEEVSPPSPRSRRREALEAIDKFRPLFGVIKKGPVAFRDLCNQLDLSPSRTEELIKEARAAGVEVSVVHNHVGIDNDPPQHVKDTHIAPVVGERQKVAVISDTHLGSKYCMRAQLKDFIHYAYSQGVRTILHPGDVLDGAYHHSVFELTHSGLEDQTYDLIETLPQLDGLTYHAITGNHDETFWKKSGVNVGRVIQAHFQDAGRDDFFVYGDRDAYLKVAGIIVHLWHPSGSGAYAKSYHPQKKIEAYTALKPQLLLCGHWHQYVHIFERGVHAIACPTFQGSMSRFSRSLKGNQAQGGLILSWDLTSHGSIRNFILEPRFYFERERPVEIYNHIDARPVAPAVARPSPVQAYPAHHFQGEPPHRG